MNWEFSYLKSAQCKSYDPFEMCVQVEGCVKVLSGKVELCSRLQSVPESSFLTQYSTD